MALDTAAQEVFREPENYGMLIANALTHQL